MTYYLPGYRSGGPIRTLTNLVERLGEEFRFKIVASDRDVFDKFPYGEVKTDTWNRVGKADVFYCSPRNQTLGALLRLINHTPHDVIYLHSFFGWDFMIKPLILRKFNLIAKKPTVLDPHGEFSEGALRLKGWLKKPYAQVARFLGLYDEIIWQATSEYEVADMKRVLGRVAARIVVAPDLLPELRTDEVFNRAVGKSAPLKILFLSRVSPKKNLDGALRIFREVNDRVDFSVVGPVDDERYWQNCQTLIRKLPRHVRVHYRGAVAPSLVSRVMAEHDLLFLPTHGENFGYVIAEALSVGTPVLISDLTPWRNLEEKGIGWDLPLDNPTAFAQEIDHCARMRPEEYMVWRRAILDKAAVLLSQDEAIEQNRQLFIQACQGSS